MIHDGRGVIAVDADRVRHEEPEASPPPCPTRHERQGRPVPVYGVVVVAGLLVLPADGTVDRRQPRHVRTLKMITPAQGGSPAGVHIQA